MTGNIRQNILRPVAIAPLVIFRVLFGLIMLVSVLRFILNGWVQTQYVDPEFFFSYYGFEWVRPLEAWGIYLLFGLMAFAAVGVMLGAFYRASATIFFIVFTYVELIDKTNYLNHYYFVSLVSLVLIFLPAHCKFSVDVCRKPSLKAEEVPYWCILILQLQLALVYFYAGTAKLNYDWLVEALPLRMWLPPHGHIPVVGALFEKLWMAYFFSWFGVIYDLTIPFFLFYKRTRGYAYVAVVAFHVLTWLLFPIGMFPFIMILATLIFFPPDFHQGLIQKMVGILRRLKIHKDVAVSRTFIRPAYSRLIMVALALFLVIQVLLPWRYMLYPGNLFWTEEGYRFSWRVMLMEKAGYAIFHVRDPETGREWEAYAHDHLTPMQEKQMSTQPDMIWQYAKFLEEKYSTEGINDPEIRVQAFVTLNGQGSRLLIDPTVDLTKVKGGLLSKNWILPFREMRQQVSRK